MLIYWQRMLHVQNACPRFPNGVSKGVTPKHACVAKQLRLLRLLLQLLNIYYGAHEVGAQGLCTSKTMRSTQDITTGKIGILAVSTLMDQAHSYI